MDSDLKNLATKAIIGGILGGGVGTLGTGEQAGESREQKRKRLLRNALLGVAGGAGLGALSEVKMANQTKTAFAEKLKGVASDLQNKAKDIDLSNPTLLAGLGSAGAAALLTGLQKRKKKESLGKKTLNVLGNAAIAGALGAGATSLLRSGTKNLEEALPASDVDPTTNLLENPLTAALSGGIGAGIGAKFTKNIQPERAIQDLKNYASALSSSSSPEESKLGEQLYKAIDAGDIGKARAKLVTLFGDPTSFAKNFSSGKSPFQTAEDLKEFLRYQNINTEAPRTLKGLINSMRGSLERGIDIRGVKGIGGRGARVGTGVLGALAGIGLPYAVSALNENLQNK